MPAADANMTMSDWIPAHQHHLLYTLAYADSLIEQIGDTLFDYIQQGPFIVENRTHNGRSEMVLQRVNPIPEVVPRLAVDALNQLRSAIEHALYAEVEHLEQRTLSDDEAKHIEMPIAELPTYLTGWCNHKWRRGIPSLQENGLLGSRIKLLQPAEAQDPQVHPLQLLAKYTNLGKHRMPVIAAARLERIESLSSNDNLEIRGKYQDQEHPKSGDVLASGISGLLVPLEILPTVAIQRPHTKSWEIMMKEVGAIEAWVRTVALPMLICGSTDVAPIPPELDLSKGYQDYADALSFARSIPASERNRLRWKALPAREELPSMFLQAQPTAKLADVNRKIAALSDAEAIEILERVVRVGLLRGEHNAAEYLRRRLASMGK